MKKNLLLGLTLALSIGILAGCTPKPSPTPSAPPQSAAPAEPSASAEAKVDYPTKPVTVIIPDKAGGSSDLLARLTFAEVEKKLGQTFSIVNKEGAGGQLGMIDVAEAAADGYTIGYLTDFSTAAAFAPGDDIGYKVEDLEFVCSITAGTNIIVVGPSYQGERSVAGLVEYAKANPGKLTVGVAASGQAQVLKSFMEKADIQLTQVMFNSGNESYTNLIGGHIDAAILGTKFDKQCSEQGGTSIAVTSHVRFSLLPEVPTLLESGYDVLNNEVSRSFMVPKGTPQEIIDLLASTIREVTDNDEFKQVLADNNEMYLYRDGSEAKAIYEQKLEQLKEVIKP